MFLSKICSSKLREEAELLSTEQVVVSSASMVTIVSTLAIETTNQNSNGVCSDLKLDELWYDGMVKLTSLLGVNAI